MVRRYAGDVVAFIAFNIHSIFIRAQVFMLVFLQKY